MKMLTFSKKVRGVERIEHIKGQRRSYAKSCAKWARRERLVQQPPQDDLSSGQP
jgi:hypothetical protein